MMKLLLPFVIVVGSLYPATALGEIIDKPADICKVAQSGKKGAWVDTIFLQKCLKLDVDSTFVQAEKDLLLRQIDSFQKENNFLKDSVTKTSEQVAKMALQVTEQEKLAAKYEEDVKRWYRNPWIMTAIGIVIGGATVAVVVVATH